MAGASSLAVPAARKTVEWQKQQQPIAAVDFGTTFCSLAYALSDAEQVKLVDLNPSKTRVPTALLMKRIVDDGTLYVREFGFNAQSDVTTLLSEEYNEHLYFELVKMLLHDTERATIDLPVSSLTGGQYYLVEVIAFVLKHIKSKLADELNKLTESTLKTSEMHWVITVPAIWTPDSKQMMREAAYMACLLSDEEGISKLTPYGTQIWSPDVWSNSDRLTLALEPECAAIYCKNVSNDHIAYISAVKKIPENVKSYLILDIGGGTTDITALTRVNDDSYEVIVPPTGNVFGGNKVNQQFEEFLEKTVQDPGFKKILKEAKKSRRYEECKAMLQKIVYHDFETIKVRFGEREGYVQRESTESTAAGASAVKYHAGTHPSALAIDDIRFELPRKFLDFYKAKKIEKELKKGSGVGIIQGKLNISSTKMASFFEPVLQKMVDCVTNIANENGPFDIAFVAGGFGGCKYVYSYLRTKLDEKLPLFVPADHKLAVSMGAVLYARAPEVITIRTMDASYGIRVSKTFDKEKHDRRHSYVGEDGNPYCGNIFKSFVAKGDKVKTTEEFTIEVTPQDHSDTEARVSIYRSSNPDVKYTTDEKTHKIGEIRLNVPNPDNLPVADRKIAVTMNLSSTEIKVRVRALYLSETSPPVTAVLDFLTK